VERENNVVTDNHNQVVKHTFYTQTDTLTVKCDTHWDSGDQQILRAL